MGIEATMGTYGRQQADWVSLTPWSSWSMRFCYIFEFVRINVITIKNTGKRTGLDISGNVWTEPALMEMNQRHRKSYKSSNGNDLVSTGDD